MGVSGVGKTTLGKALSLKLRLPFYDADNFHPQENIQKMEQGIPLNDEDRYSWLETLAREISVWSKNGAVIACSALKEKYRGHLQLYTEESINWIYLYEEYEVILDRLKTRKGHFFKPELLKSQFETLEPPEYGIHIKVGGSPEKTINSIMEILSKPAIGIIGLGVMGKSLALNMSGKDISVLVYNRELKGVEENVAKNFEKEIEGKYRIPSFNNLKKFIGQLPRPRNILLMIKAGNAVDSVIEDLIPLLDKDDLIIDGGNSHYKDTLRRGELLKKNDILFMGAGISGGEEGALKGPSLMPGGSKKAYQRIEPVLDLIAAKDKNGKACSGYIGSDGSGHFVKMLHNGIEYGEMQLIAEFYHFMRFYLKMPVDEIASLFSHWNSDLHSYLLEISEDILRSFENDKLILDNILDVAGQKGTGGWSTIAALELGVPLDTITAAVMARNISGNKDRRRLASEKYQNETGHKINVESIQKDLFHAFKMVHIINHATGFELLHEASKQYKWDLNLSEIARIWTNGCIIRSGLMESLVQEIKESPDQHMLLHPEFITEIQKIKPSLHSILSAALQLNCPLPVSSAAANYLMNFRSGQSSANMIQAQRDYFGAHQYERLDKPRGEFYHTIWKKTN